MLPFLDSNYRLTIPTIDPNTGTVHTYSGLYAGGTAKVPDDYINNKYIGAQINVMIPVNWWNYFVSFWLEDLRRCTVILQSAFDELANFLQILGGTFATNVNTINTLATVLKSNLSRLVVHVPSPIPPIPTDGQVNVTIKAGTIDAFWAQIWNYPDTFLDTLDKFGTHTADTVAHGATSVPAVNRIALRDKDGYVYSYTVAATGSTLPTDTELNVVDEGSCTLGMRCLTVGYMIDHL